MDIDDDDDFYAPEEPETTEKAALSAATATANAPAADQHDEDLEEGEEEDEGAEMDEDDESDIDIITERKDGTKAPPPPTARYSDIRNIPQRTTSIDGAMKPAVKKEDSKSISGAELPPVATSKIDVDAIPIHKPTGKPLTAVNIDDDLTENDKPWRKPGTDLSDYFNYGFDEFTWALYAARQESIRGEFNQESISQNNKKMMEEMQMMMMGGMPAGGNSMAAMPGMEGMAPEMQQMLQQMMANGIDPTQMDPSAMAAMFGGMPNAGGNGAVGQAGQNFGGTGQGFNNNQGQGYGYDNQGMGRGGGGGGFGRGRGRGRNW